MSHIQTLIACAILCVLVFLSDIMLHYAAFSLFYVIIVSMTSLVGDSKSVLISMIITTALAVTSLAIRVQTYEEIGSFESLFRLSTIIVIFISSFISIKQKAIEDQLRSLASSLELRVLARTAAAEARSRQLENQIQVLRLIRREAAVKTISKLDGVIVELKRLSELEVSDE